MLKLGCITLLDVRSPLISQTFSIRKKKPEAFAYQKRIFDLSLLCFSLSPPPTPLAKRSHASIIEIASAKQFASWR